MPVQVISIVSSPGSLLLTPDSSSSTLSPLLTLPFRPALVRFFVFSRLSTRFGNLTLHDRPPQDLHRFPISFSEHPTALLHRRSIIAFTAPRIRRPVIITHFAIIKSKLISMAASNIVFGSLSIALAQAITYITRPLIVRYSAVTIIKLQLALEANLTAQFTPSWVPAEPLRGSGRRCLTLSPFGVPPRPIYNACKSAGVEWSEWIALLGNFEFDLFIDPGCVSIRFGSSGAGQFITVWAEDAMAVKKQSNAEKEARLDAQLKTQAAARATSAKPAKTYAQELLEVDQEDEELFALIADEIREPTWLTPILSEFPAVPAPERSITSSPMSTVSTLSSHSRSSSSSSSSGFTFSSVESDESLRSTTTVSQAPYSTSPSEKPKFKLSRRERARQARVFVDTSKTAVTNYDGGKTTVLTGGVMLGAANKPKPIAAPKKASSSNSSWRSLSA
ncbi:hypothetical protein BD414DRAFT_238598 [Trametes punicea]|nr:hypothetical protein BD414DRAFT_238598 [Trametes punicea]